jgi:tetratricopeptide (TPR) repeat protein
MRSLLITLFLITYICSNAQNKAVGQAEMDTYNSFIKNDYKSTIKVGRQAINQGADSYYIRYRIGVSCYQIKNYEAAITHLEKAKSLDSNDAGLLEYLYYAYIFTNRNEKAAEILTLLPDDLKEKINYKHPLFKSIEVEVGILKTNNFDQIQNKDIKNGTLLGHGTFYSDVQFANLSINNQIGNNFKLKNIFSGVINTSNDMGQFVFQTPEVITNKNKYYQWNIIGSYFIKDWRIGAGFGLYNSSYISYTTVLKSDFPPIFEVQELSKTTNTNYSGSLSLSKKLKYIEPTIAASYTNLSESKTICAEGSLSYFPFGNLNFYGNSKVGMVKNENENHAIYSQLIGLKLAKKVWLEGYGAYGNHLNYVSENGLFVFNTPNKINWYAGTNLNFYFKKIDFSVGYGMQEREASYYSEPNPTSTITTNYTYNYNLLKTKIVWKF